MLRVKQIKNIELARLDLEVMETKPKRPQLDSTVCLPRGVAAPEFEDILYRIGLCMTSVKEEPFRRRIDHPMVAFTIVSVFMIERIITCSLPEDNHFICTLLGSTGYFISIRQHFDLFFILLSILSLSSQIIYYVNYKKGVNPTFLRLFRMMSGSVPPKAIGLTDEKKDSPTDPKNRKVVSTAGETQ